MSNKRSLGRFRMCKAVNNIKVMQFKMKLFRPQLSCRKNKKKKKNKNGEYCVMLACSEEKIWQLHFHWKKMLFQYHVREATF